MKKTLEKKLKILGKEFQKITGKPFLPSPKDSAFLIKLMEKNFPLQIIIEGIKMGWQKKKRKCASISSFKKDIERAIISYRENMIGRASIEFDKEMAMIKEITDFLHGIPEELDFTKGIFQRALRIIKSRKGEDEKEKLLENLEAELEEILIKKYGKEGIAEKKILKELRWKFKIPRLLRYFY